MNNDPIIKKKKTFFMVWLMPLLAILLGGWMMYSYYQNKGVELIVTFKSGEGFEAGKTPLMFNGIQVGKVTGVTINPDDISKVDVTITVTKNALGLPRKGNMFWKVSPKVSLTEITGLNALLSGAYIQIMPAIKDLQKIRKLPYTTHFIALDTPPTNTFEPGITLILTSDEADLQEGAPVIFRKQPIGKILQSSVTKRGVTYTIHIDRRYASLIREHSLFWKISGVEMRASLAGISLEMDSLATVITGAIEVDSPNAGEPLISPDVARKLYDNKSDAQLGTNTITLIAQNGYNIDPKLASVYFQGMEAGKVLKVSYSPTQNATFFTLKLKEDFAHLANQDAYFWIVEPKVGLTQLEGLEAISRGPFISFETSSNSLNMKNTFSLHTTPPPMKGVSIALRGKDAAGLSVGSNIIYRNIIIGSIRSLSLSRDGKEVIYDAIIADQYRHILNDTSHFYPQKALDFDASLAGIYFNIGSASSLLHGGITMETKNLSAKFTRKNFVLEENSQALQDQEYTQSGGKTLILTARTLGSLKQGSPILYKGIKAGKILSYSLNPKSDTVDFTLYIEPKYASYINSSTMFYNLSGVRVKADLSGVDIQTGSLESIVAGGVGFKTPLKADEVKDMDRFTLYDNEQATQNQYTTIHLTSQSSPEIKEGTKVIYKSIIIGRVESLELDGDMIDATVLIDQRYKRFLVNDTLFWSVDASIKINGVKNVSTILGGSYISLMPGKSTTTRQNYSILSGAPIDSIHKEGLRVKLIGSRLHGISEGAPLFYRQIQIGNVEKYTLTKDATGVEMTVFINPCYAHLVRQNSLFYNATVLGMDVGLFSAKLRTETISTMVNGGIVLATPNKYGARASSMETFKLYDDAKDEWREWAPALVSEEKCTSEN
jgi:paraquat-inducible protein B